MKDPERYRPCAGIMLINAKGLIFTGRRMNSVPGNDAWQMPQGGIDPGEDSEAAALRELGEETGIAPQKVNILARSATEHYYDLPEEMRRGFWGGRYLGQRQIWFAMRFLGEDSDVNIFTKHQEFQAWRWSSAQQVIDHIVPFKKSLYEDVLKEFSEHI